MRLCKSAGCYSIAIEGACYCAKHLPNAIIKANQKKQKAKEDMFKHAKRSNEALYQTNRWRKLSLELRKDAVCYYCNSESNLSVHHTITGELSEEIFFNPDYLVVVCKDCHKELTHQMLKERNQNT